jgi:CRP-like cAMP-binding protein
MGLNPKEKSPAEPEMSAETAVILSFLRTSRPFRDLPAEDLEALARRSSLHRLDRGEVLALRTAPGPGVYGVVEGFVKAVAHSARGRTFLADIIGPRRFVGFAAALLGGERSMDLRASTDCEVVFVPAQAIDALLALHPALARGIAVLIAQRLQLALEQLRANTFLDAAGGLALRLSRLLEAHGEPAPEGGLTLPFDISQEELGQLIGVTREAVGRCLRLWAHEGWVELGYARLVVRRPEALAALCEDESFGD